MNNKSIPDALQEQYEKGVNAERISNYKQASQHYSQCIVLDKQTHSIIADGTYKSLYIGDKMRVEQSLNQQILHSIVSRDI